MTSDSTKDALLRNEAWYKMLMEGILDGLYIIDTKGCFSFVNDVIAKRSGLPKDWFIGRHYLDVIKPEYKERSRKSFDANMRGETSPPYEVELVYERPSGGSLWVEVMRKPLHKNDRIIGILGVSRDITERKRAERALKEARERYRNIFENAVEGIFQSAPDGKLVQANRAFARILGYGSPEECLQSVKDVGRQLCVNPAQPDDDKRLPEKEGPHSFDLQVNTKDGNKIWILNTVKGVRTEDGKIAFYEGSILDITERKRSEEELERYKDRLEQLVAERTNALRESEKRYRDLVDNALMGVYQTTIDGEILYQNKYFVRMLGFESLEELKASGSPARYKNPEDRKAFIKLLKKTGKVMKYEVELLAKDDDVINVLLSASLTGDIISGMALDITDWKKTEEALKASEQNLRLVFNSMHDAIFIHDAQGTILEVNDKMPRVV